MTDLRQRLHDIETLRQPDLWTDIARRRDAGVYQSPSRRTSRLPVFAVSFAVLALVAIIVGALLPLGEGGKNPGGVGGNSDATYHAPAGWSITLPAGWHALPFETSQGGASAVGVQLSNVKLPSPTMVAGVPIQTSAKVLPPDGVSLIIATDQDPSGVQKPPKRPPTPPLDNYHWLVGIGGDQAPGPSVQALWFQWNGQTYIASGKVGTRATAKDRAALDSIMRSLRFPPSSPTLGKQYRSGWVTFSNPSEGFQIQYPSDWMKAGTRLTTTTPNELVALGTFPLPPQSGGCAQFPENALGDLGSRDAMILVWELPPPDSGVSAVPERPGSFGPSFGVTIDDSPLCVTGPVVFDHWLGAFQDQGRLFEVFVAIGKQSSPGLSGQAWHVLDSISISAPSP
jgi:hypothetical protein